MLFQSRPNLGTRIGFIQKLDNFFSNIRKNEKQAKEKVDSVLKQNDPWTNESQNIMHSSVGTHEKTGSLQVSREPMDLLTHVGRMNIVLDKVKKSADSENLVLPLRQACQIYIEENQSDQIKTMIVMPWKKFETPVGVTELTQLKENLSKVRLDMDADRKLLEAALKAVQLRIDRVSGS